MLKKILDNKKELIGIILIFLFTCYLFFVLGISKLKFGIIDDHEIYYISNELNTKSVFELLNEFMIADGRFRILYWINRILTIKLLGTNYYLYFAQFMLFALLSLEMLYAIFRKLKVNIFFAIILSIFPFWGPQIDSFMRLGTGELFSSFLLIASVFFFVIKDSKFNKILAGIFLSFAVISKETFMISAPFVLFLFIMLPKNSGITYLKQIRNNILLYILPIFIFLLSLYLNFSSIYTGNTAYKVYISFNQLLSNLKNILLSQNSYFIYETIFFVIIVAFGLFYCKNKKNFNNIVLCYITGLAFALTQFIFIVLITSDNYYQSRYLIPFVFSTVLFMFLYLYICRNKYLPYLLLVPLFIYNICYFTPTNIENIVDGNIAFNSTLEETLLYLDENSKILFIGDPIFRMEYFESFKRYYEFYGYKNIYVIPIASKKQIDITPFEQNLCDHINNFWKNRIISDLSINPELILFFNSEYIDKFDLVKYINFDRRYYDVIFYKRMDLNEV